MVSFNLNLTHKSLRIKKQLIVKLTAFMKKSDVVKLGFILLFHS